MNTNKPIYIASFFLLMLMSLGCFNDLNTIPIDEDLITSETVYSDPTSYLGVLAKLYAGLQVTGQEGPHGQPDILGIAEGYDQYTRGYFHIQELTTDECVVGWNDQTIKDYHNQSWTADDPFLFAFYSRIFYQIPLCNEFLRESTDEKLDSRGVDAQMKDEIHGYRAEARFLRALSYWHALDIFRNVPFVTEENNIGAFFPEQIKAEDLFNYIESELLAIENEIATVRTNEYGRADQGAVWALLTKLYLNAEVYIGVPKYDECLTFCEKILEAGYSLEPEYQNLFLADNHLSEEIIFPVTFDGIHTKTWGGTTFLIRAGIGGSMDPSDLGVASGWAGLRTTRQLVEKFPGELGGIIVEANEGNTQNYAKIYVPGDYQGWDVNNLETALSSYNNDKVFEGYKYFSEDNSRFVFTRYPGGGLIYGDTGMDGSLEINGDTLIAGPSGLYFMEVDLNDNSYKMERRTWSLIGDATDEMDLEMHWDEDAGALTVTADLKAGSFRFRSSNNGEINLGDTDADAILFQDGDPIILEKASTYRIMLFIDKPDYTYQINDLSYDRRALFYTDGQNIDINDLTLFNDGYAIQKFKNITSYGATGSNTEHPDTDFPMFRLADIYLTAAEAIIRNNGDLEKASEYFNAVRERAYQGEGGNITSDQLNLELLIDERGRELYWESHRRTDLIRFGKFSQSNYLWAWKGGEKDGISVEKYRDVFPIPSADISANPNLQQNEGY